jgi:ribonuclease HI
MPWKRHLLRDAQIWAEVDDTGQLVTDSGGRVAVIYKREPNAKIYRAGARNLGPVDGAPIEADLPGSSATAAPVAPAAPAAAKGATGATRKPRGGVVPEGRLGEPSSPDTVHVWTDGACQGNPGPCGVGVVVIDGKSRKEHGEFLGHGTNNIAELTAVLRGLDLVGDTQRPVRVYSDSSYSIGVLSLGWKPKVNQELIAEIKDRITAFRDLRFVKVKGHSGIPENERCDQLATGAIKNRQP